MDKVILAIGILIMFEGVLLIVKPKIYKKLIAFFMRGRMIYLAGVIRLVLGVLFLVSAMSCKKPWLIIAFGVLLLISGTLTFVIKLEKIKAMLNWFSQKSLVTIRLLAIIAIAIGAVLAWGS